MWLMINLLIPWFWHYHWLPLKILPLTFLTVLYFFIHFSVVLPSLTFPRGTNRNPSGFCFNFSVFQELWPTTLLCPWHFPGKNTRVGCHFLLQGIFPIQGSRPSLLHHLHWQVDSLPLVPPRTPPCKKSV